MDFEIASQVSGNDRVGGVGRVFYAEVADFTTIAQLPAAPATQADKVTISADHTFGGTDGFRVMYSTPNKTSVEANGVGDDGSVGSEVVANCFFPGTDQEFSAFLKDDPDLILLVEHPDCAQGEYIQVGSKCRAAKIARDWAFTTGVAPDGGKGFNFKVRAYMSSLIFYTGTLTEAT